MAGKWHITAQKSAASGGTPAAPGQPASSGWTAVVDQYNRDPITGQQTARIFITISDRPADAKYFSLFGYRGASAPSDPSAWGDGIGSVLMAASGDTTIEHWVKREDAEYTLQLAVTASKAEYFQFPTASTPVKAVTIPAAGLPLAITGFAVGVTVKTDSATFDKMGRYDFVFDATPDLNRMEVWIQRRWTDSGYSPVPGADGQWGTVAIIREPSSQDNFWPMVLDEYHQWRAVPVDWSGAPNYTGAAVVNLHVVPGVGIKVGTGLANTAGGLVATATGANLLRNYDFSAGKAAWVSANQGAGAKFEIVTGAGEFYSPPQAALVGTPWGDIRQAFACTPGQTYWAKAWGKTKLGTQVLGVHIWFLDAAGNAVLQPAPVTLATRATWGETPLMIATAPTNAAQVEIIVAVSNPAAGHEWYVDNVQAGILPPMGQGLTSGSNGLAINNSSEFRYNATTGALEMQNVDLGKASNYNANEFEVVNAGDGNKLRMKVVSADKVLAGILQVGGGGGKVSLLKIFDTASQLIGWIGDLGSGGYIGAWFKRVLIGGDTPANAKIAAGADGSVTINGAPLTMANGNEHVEINALSRDGDLVNFRAYNSVADMETQIRSGGVFGSEYADPSEITFGLSAADLGAGRKVGVLDLWDTDDVTGAATVTINGSRTDDVSMTAAKRISSATGFKAQGSTGADLVFQDNAGTWHTVKGGLIVS